MVEPRWGFYIYWGDVLIAIDRALVLIPLHKEYLTPAERFSFLNTLEVLSAHNTRVICPERLSDYVNALREQGQHVFDIEFFPDEYFFGVAGYNRLLLSADFYLRFSAYEYVLIVQTDALVLADRLQEWCDRNYSYVGSPWFKGLTRPTKPLSFLGVGNGGFSLRRVPDFISVLASFEHAAPGDGQVILNTGEKLRFFRFMFHCLVPSRNLPPLRLKINEDIFWGVIAPYRHEHFVVPSPEEAVDFAFETAPEYLFDLNGRRLPFGCHAWERYNPQFWRERAKDIGMELP